MAAMPRGQPRSAADPDKEAYEAAMRKERVLRERREAEEAQQRKTQRTANIVSHELLAAEKVPALVGELGHDPAARSASKAIGRVAGPAGTVASAVGAQAGYRADRAAGMPRDEAAIKNGGGFVTGQLGEAGSEVLGAEVGSMGGPVGAAVGGVIDHFGGGKFGEAFAGEAAKYWAEVKAQLFRPRSGYGPESNLRTWFRC